VFFGDDGENPFADDGDEQNNLDGVIGPDESSAGLFFVGVEFFELETEAALLLLCLFFEVTLMFFEVVLMGFEEVIGVGSSADLFFGVELFEVMGTEVASFVRFLTCFN